MKYKYKYRYKYNYDYKYKYTAREVRESASSINQSI